MSTDKIWRSYAKPQPTDKNPKLAPRNPNLHPNLMQYAEANPRICPYISKRLKALVQRVRNRLKHVLTYLHSPKWLTQMRGYIYATAAPGVGGGFEADSRPCPACHAAARTLCLCLCAVRRCHAMPCIRYCCSYCYCYASMVVLMSRV